MNTKTRTRISLPIAAMVLTAALAFTGTLSLTAAPQQLFLKGTLEGQDTTPCEGQAVLLCSTATGHGTHLGRFTFTQTVTLDFQNFTDSGVGHWTAANGDRIDTAVAGGLVSSDDPDFHRIVETHTITGGTGRFTGAQGSIKFDRLHKITASDDGTHMIFGSLQGTITFPGDSH
jgi:hypothetical protein